MSESKLPADPLSLILGILALIISVGGCCLSGLFFPFAILAILPIVISIIGLTMANKSLKVYEESPEIYLKTSRDNVKTAKTLNIITLIFGGLVFLSLLIGFIFLGTTFYKIFDDLDQEGVFDQEYSREIQEADTIYDYEDTYEIEEIEIQEIEKDTLMIDSTIIEEIKEIEIIEN